MLGRLYAFGLVACCLGAGCLPGAANAQDENETPQQAALRELRGAIAARDLAAIQTKTEAATKLKGEEPYDTELYRVEQLGKYVSQFWVNVDRVCQNMQTTGLREITVGDLVCAFVEYNNNTLVIRVSGMNRSYTLRNMPIKVALAVAQQQMPADNPDNKVYFGALYAMDPKGDRKLARQMWDEAIAAKLEIKHLLPELDLEPPPPAVAIPALTAATRAQLQPRNWSLRVKGPKNWQKKPLGDTATQNEEGRLVFTAPADGGEVQLVLGRQLPPNFGCRIYLDGVRKGQTIGLLANNGEEDALSISLPQGTVVFELARQNGQLKARVHGKDVELEASGKAVPRMPALLGITVPAGAQVTVAALEMGAP